MYAAKSNPVDAPAEGEAMNEKMNEKSTHRSWDLLVGWAQKFGGRHPLAPALGIIVLLSALLFAVFTVGLGDNTRFLMLLLTLTVLLLSIFFTFSPPPANARRAAVGFFATVVTSSLCLNAPLPVRDWFFGLARVKVETPSPQVPAPSAASAAALPAPAMVSKPFEVIGPSVNVGCEETSTGSVHFLLPERATLQSSHAAWINLVAVTQNSAKVTVSGLDVVANGTIRGRNRDNIAFGLQNCPGGGHGNLVLTGTYSISSQAK
jgi:hypothetical protein